MQLSMGIFFLRHDVIPVKDRWSCSDGLSLSLMSADLLGSQLLVACFCSGFKSWKALCLAVCTALGACGELTEPCWRVALGTCLPPRLSKVLGSGVNLALGGALAPLHSLQGKIRQGEGDQKAPKQELSKESASGVLAGAWASSSGEPVTKSQLQTVSFPLTTANPN